LEDGAVREPVVEHAVDEVAGGLGEAGDFAVTGTLFPTEEISEIAEEAGGLASARSGEGGAVSGWIHGSAVAALWRDELVDCDVKREA
jgi:hypothetical protein